MKKTKSPTAIIFLLLFLLAALFVFNLLQKEYTLQKYPLPEEYLTYIEKYSKEYDIPVDLLCAVINTESSFDPSARSHADAYGMMQITEETFNWLQFKMGISGTYTADKLYDPEINIRFGAYFLHLLYAEFQDCDTVLAAYNAGRGRVLTWLGDPNVSENGKLVNIPYKETRDYIKKVNNARIKYQELYFKENISE